MTFLTSLPWSYLTYFYVRNYTHCLRLNRTFSFLIMGASYKTLIMLGFFISAEIRKPVQFSLWFFTLCIKTYQEAPSKTSNNWDLMTKHLRVKTNPSFSIEQFYVHEEQINTPLFVEFGMFSLAPCPSKSRRAELNKLNEVNLLPCPTQVATRPWTRLPGQLVNINDTSTAAEFILGAGFCLLPFLLQVFPPFHWEKWGSQVPNKLKKWREIQLASLHCNWYKSIITRQIAADNAGDSSICYPVPAMAVWRTRPFHS